MAGRRQGGPRYAGPGALSPGLSGQRRAVDEADRLLRQTQTHQQPAGRQRPRK